jgi:hypothetical protein
MELNYDARRPSYWLLDLDGERSTGVPALLDRLQKAVAAGELAAQRVDDSLVRVATMKGATCVIRDHI